MKKRMILLICSGLIAALLLALLILKPEAEAEDELQTETAAYDAAPVMVPQEAPDDPDEPDEPDAGEKLQEPSANEAEAVPEAPCFAKLVFTGDVELSASVQGKYDSFGINGVVSERLLPILREADVLMINNEFCFSLRGEKNPEKQFTFRVDPAYVSLLTDMGTDIAGLANNHVLDYGKTALLDTFSTLEDAGIEFTGAGNDLEEASKLIIKEHPDGRKIGFLAASHVIPSVDWNVTNSQPGEFCFYDETDLLNAIGEAKRETDLLFVMVHWGVESTTQLTDYQVNDAHRFIDAGADAVIGMHSHCLQPVEIYRGKPVFYSLGNFIFNRTIGTGGGGCVEVAISGNEAPRYRIIPTCASDALTDTDESALSYVEGISDGIRVDEEGFISGTDG